MPNRTKSIVILFLIGLMGAAFIALPNIKSPEQITYTTPTATPTDTPPKIITYANLSSALDDPKPETTLTKTIKIADFFPKNGETIADLKLTNEYQTSGSIKELGIDYYPEKIIITQYSQKYRTYNYNLYLEGIKFKDFNDTQKYLNKGTGSLTCPDSSETSKISDWSGYKCTWTDSITGEGSFRITELTHNEYFIKIAVRENGIAYPEEKAESIANELINKFNTAI